MFDSLKKSREHEEFEDGYGSRSRSSVGCTLLYFTVVNMMMVVSGFLSGMLRMKVMLHLHVS